MSMATRIKIGNVSENKKTIQHVLFQRFVYIYKEGRSHKRQTYRTWLFSTSGNPLMGEDTTGLNSFLSHSQKYPFIPPLLIKENKK